MIDFGLQEDHQLIVASLKDFAKAELRQHLRKTEEDGPSEALRRAYHEMGLAGIDYPESLGGQELGAMANVLAEEELAWGDPGAAVALDGLGLFGRALMQLGDEKQQRRWLAPLLGADGAGRRGAFAWSEPSGRDGFATVASRDGDGWVLNGRKSWVLHAGDADAVVVVARLEPAEAGQELGAFVVDKGNEGLRPGERLRLLGLNAAHVHHLTLEGCRVPAEARLLGGDAGLVSGLRNLFSLGALVNAARLVGLSRAAYEYALVYAEERKAFGKPIAHFQAISFNLADMALEVNAARWLTWKAAWRVSEKGIGRAHKEVAFAYGQAIETARRLSDRCVQILGGAGYVQDHPAEKWMRDANTLGLLGASSEQANAVAYHELLGVAGDAAPDELLPGMNVQGVLT